MSTTFSEMDWTARAKPDASVTFEWRLSFERRQCATITSGVVSECNAALREGEGVDS